MSTHDQYDQTELNHEFSLAQWQAVPQFSEIWIYIQDPDQPDEEASPELAARILDKLAADAHNTAVECYLNDPDGVTCRCGRTNQEHYDEQWGANGQPTGQMRRHIVGMIHDEIYDPTDPLMAIMAMIAAEVGRLEVNVYDPWGDRNSSFGDGFFG